MTFLTLILVVPFFLVTTLSVQILNSQPPVDYSSSAQCSAGKCQNPVFSSHHDSFNPTLGDEAFCTVNSIASPNLWNGHSGSPASRLRLSSIVPVTLSDSPETAISPSLFGSPRKISATAADLKPYRHPRVVFGRGDWRLLLERYADPKYFNVWGTWSNFFRTFSVRFGPQARIITILANIHRSGLTGAYKPRPYANTTEYSAYRQSLASLAANLSLSHPNQLDALFLCALWAGVAEIRWKLGYSDFLSHNATSLCIDATVAWATIVLAHRTYHCNPTCPRSGRPKDRAYVWDTSRMWGIHHDWFLGGVGLALAYDVLFSHMAYSQRITVRSAIAMIVLRRHTWGTTPYSSLSSPNVMEQPHRIFSNWAGYNANLYVINLAIQGESRFDLYASSILRSHHVTGFNSELDSKYSALLKEYMKHSFYPDGSTFEDGYSYFAALREGSIAFLALERRSPGLLTSPRFRNIIHNVAQMTEPWQCGDLIGHAGGGGNLYNTHVGLFRYVYPNGALPNMIWMQRFGRKFENMNPCRTVWFQSALQLAILGGEHGGNSESFEELHPDMHDSIPTAFYSPRRGLLIARSSFRENASYVHFDCRPDAFIVGHDNADRGTFTYSVLRKTWIVDLPWRNNIESIRHSLLHIDGLAEGNKAPSCKPLKVDDYGAYVISAGDLTYSYNNLWADAPFANESFTRHMVSYDNEGNPTVSVNKFDVKELNGPWSLGWPEDDYARDIGFTSSTKLNGVEDIGISGLWLWKRPYRSEPINHLVRSVVVSRSWGDPNDVGLLVVVDSIDAGPGMHKFESYVILHESVTVIKSSSQCHRYRCVVSLKHGSGSERVDVYALSLSTRLSYRFERFDHHKKSRIVFESIAEQQEEIWLVFHAHVGERGEFSVTKLFRGFEQKVENEVIRVSTETHEVFLGIDSADHSAKLTAPSSSFSGHTSAHFLAVQYQPPMNPIVLTLWRTRWLHWNRFTEDREKFFSETKRSRQLVLKMYSRSNARKGLVDVLNTCFVESGLVADVLVYDCSNASPMVSDGDGYKSRSCSIVQSTRITVGCKQDNGMRIQVVLTPGQLYYVVVSADILKGKMQRLVLLHETVENTRAKLSHMPHGKHIFAHAPMNVFPLRDYIGWELTDSDFGSDEDAFYSAEEGVSQQIVFSFTGLADEDEDLEDVLTTCSSHTNVMTHLAVYDCGDGDRWIVNYKTRTCDMVRISGDEDLCRGFRSRLRVQLDAGRKYLLVVSIYNHFENRVLLDHFVSHV